MGKASAEDRTMLQTIHHRSMTAMDGNAEAPADGALQCLRLRTKHPW
ncbi:hypothetical protein [Silicimonas algicola]|nr:hypothetical protein [Silicimonas algicola]